MFILFMNKYHHFQILKENYRQILAVISANLYLISDGITNGWTSPYVPYLLSEKSHIKTTIRDAEWLETVLVLGLFSGLPGTIYLVEKIGRKKSLLLSAFVAILVWTTIALANRIEYILVARYFCGAFSNMSMVAAPLYVLEIADQQIRGFLMGIIYVMILLGCFIVYCVGPYLPFYVSPMIGGSAAALGLITFTFIPESPYYLCCQKRSEDAKKSLEYFKQHCNAQKKMSAIYDGIAKQRKENGRIRDLVLAGSNRKVIMIVIVLNVGQQLCADAVIIMNLHLILNSAGSTYVESSVAAILYSALMLITVVISSVKLDEYGRKALLLFSSVLTGVCLITIAIYFNLKLNGFDVATISWIPIVSVMAYASVFNVGMGLVPLVITAEIFPPNLKSIGMALADTMFALGSIVAIQIYQRLSVYGIYAPFYFFGICAFFIAIFTAFQIPETKGKSLDEIELMLYGNRSSVIDEKRVH